MTDPKKLGHGAKVALAKILVSDHTVSLVRIRENQWVTKYKVIVYK